MEQIEIIEEYPETEIVEDPIEFPTETEEFIPKLEVEEETEESDINDLLIEYIKTQLSEDESEIESEDIVDQSDNNVIEENYVPQIDAILEELRSTESNIEYQAITLDDYIDNNNLQSNINEVSLSNLLLIMIFVSILFSAVLNFSRRIF